MTQTGSTGVSRDSRGNTTAIGSTSYAYTTEDRLSGGGAATLTYNPEGTLLSETGAATTRFDTLGATIITERDGSGNRLRRFVPGPGIDEHIVWYEGFDLSTRRYHHQDERGSVIAVSDASGNLVGSINRYDEYGVPQGTLTGRFGYTGQPWIPDAGLYHYRARAYNPAMGRFMQTDPIGYDGGMNFYTYVGNNPVNFNDPSGLQQEVVVIGRRPLPQNAPSSNFHGFATSPGLAPQEPDFVEQRRRRRNEPDCTAPDANPENCAVVTGNPLTPPPPPLPPASLSLPITFAGDFYPAAGGDFSWDSSNRRRRRLTLKQRLGCAMATAIITGMMTNAHLGHVELLIAATGGAAGRGARLGRSTGTLGMAIGAFIGGIFGYATFEADRVGGSRARILEYCRGRR